MSAPAQHFRAARALAYRDSRVVFRDSMLAMIVVMPPLLAVGLRFAVPLIPIEFIDVYLAPMAILMPPLLVGAVLGFIMVEEREFGTDVLLRVLPVPRGYEYGYGLVVSSSLSFFVGIASYAVYSYPTPPADPLGVLVLLVPASLFAPFTMLSLACLAHNKIEAMAVSKIFNLQLLGPALAFALPGWWQLLLTWLPLYWVYLGLLRAGAGPEAVAALQLTWPSWPGWAYSVVPTLICCAACWALARIHRRRVA